VGVVCLLLMTLSVYHVEYSMDGRPYMLLLVLTVGQYLSLYAFLAQPRPWLLVPFVRCGAAALYTHHTAIVTQATLGLLTLGVLASALRLRSADPERARRELRTVLAVIGAFAAVGILYLPQLPYLFQFLGSGRLAAKHALRLSPSVFHEVFARWGGGVGWIAYLWDAGFLVGLATLAVRRDRSLGIALWLLGPFLPFALIPFAKFFDVRFVMTALPPFHLITAVGFVVTGRLVARAIAQAGASRRVAAGAGAAVVVAATLLPAAVGARAYLTFRGTRARCSNFVWAPGLLDRDDGFCRKHIILNSLLPHHAELLLRSVGPPGAKIGGPLEPMGPGLKAERNRAP
jgi:hypothetical protein